MLAKLQRRVFNNQREDAVFISIVLLTIFAALLRFLVGFGAWKQVICADVWMNIYVFLQ